MKTWFVSRHPGALEWARRRGMAIDHHVGHLDPADVDAADTVLGTLPVNLAAEICARGARYFHLSVKLPAELRGQELSAEALESLGAKLEAFIVRVDG